MEGSVCEVLHKFTALQKELLLLVKFIGFKKIILINICNFFVCKQKKEDQVRVLQKQKIATSVYNNSVDYPVRINVILFS